VIEKNKTYDYLNRAKRLFSKQKTMTPMWFKKLITIMK